MPCLHRIVAASTARALTVYLRRSWNVTASSGMLIRGGSHDGSHYELPISRSRSCGWLRIWGLMRKRLRTSDVGY